MERAQPKNYVVCPDKHKHEIAYDGSRFPIYGFLVSLKGPCRWNRFRFVERERKQ